MITLVSVILMQMPNYELTIPGGQVDIDVDRIEITENQDGTVTIRLLKDDVEDE